MISVKPMLAERPQDWQCFAEIIESHCLATESKWHAVLGQIMTMRMHRPMHLLPIRIQTYWQIKHVIFAPYRFRMIHSAWLAKIPSGALKLSCLWCWKRTWKVTIMSPIPHLGSDSWQATNSKSVCCQSCSTRSARLYVVKFQGNPQTPPPI